MVSHKSGGAENEYFLDRLGVRWYLNFSPDTSDIPTGIEKLPHIGAIEPGNLLSTSTIASLVGSAPAGSYWYVGGEPNRKSITGAQFAEVFDYYHTHIKSADPTAKITGPSILNWDFTCIGCSGYTSGETWLRDFIDTYRASYGQPPPVDVWAIDTYPIDWNNTPNSATHASIVISQLQGMRQYLNTIPEYVDTPIWITELAVHVGYDGWIWDPFPTQIAPVGIYHWDKMSDYLIAVLDWLEDNAASNLIERWFLFTTWRDIVNMGSDEYMGIVFFEGPDVGASLNCLGEIYRSWALGLPRVKCDANGNTVPADS